MRMENGQAVAGEFVFQRKTNRLGIWNLNGKQNE